MRNTGAYFSFYSVVGEYFKRIRIQRDWLMTYQLTFLKIICKKSSCLMAENEFCLRQLFQ